MSLTLTQALAEIVKEFPDKVCLQLKKEDSLCAYTYRQMYDSAVKVGNWLYELGIRKSDRVAIILENCPQWGIAYFGILFSQGTAVPIDIQSSFEEVEYILKDSQVRVVFVSSAVSYGKELEKFDFLEKIVVIGKEYSAGKVVSFSQLFTQSADINLLPKPDPDVCASIIYTSGTTGLPKGVMLTHNNFYSNYASLKKLNILGPGDTILSFLPLHHAYPFLVTFIVPLFSGSTIAYIEALKIEYILYCLQQEKITVMVVVPQILYLFYRGITEQMRHLPFYLRWLITPIREILWAGRKGLKINLSKLLFSRVHRRMGGNLRFFVSGGAKLDKKIATFFFKLGFDIIEGYGLSEASPVVSLNLQGKQRIGSVGKVLPGVQVRIVNPDKSGVGEVIVRGPNVMKGYYHREAETKVVLKHGWLYTGDSGYIDKKGYLYIKGRIKEVIVLSSGKNVSPDEVEAYYLKSPFIKEICVMPNEKEDALVAVVVPDLEYFKKIKEVNVHQIVKWRLEYLSQKLPSYKRIRGFVLVNKDLPRTRLGKIKRFKASQVYRENVDKHVPRQKTETQPELSGMAGEILDILKKERNVKAIFLDDHLELDLGIDSLSRVEIMLALERSLEVKINEQAFAKIFTVKELIDNMEQLSSKKGQVSSGEEQISWKKILDLPPQETLRRTIDLKGSPTSRAVTLLIGIGFDFLFRIFFQLRVYGKGNLPKQRFILCPNHTSYLDGFVIFSSLPLRFKYNLFFIGLSKYFEVPLLRSFIRYFRVIPVDISRNLIETMKAASLVLRNNKTLCVFPEGSRSVDGGIKEFKKGIGILVKELAVGVVPVYIKGTYKAWKSTAAFPRPYPVEVIFGRAYSFQELKEKGIAINSEADDYLAATLGLQDEVRRLGKEIP